MRVKKWRWNLPASPSWGRRQPKAAKAQGIRMLRSDKLDEQPNPEAPFRDDALRGLVDALPPIERHVISRVFFGGETLQNVAAELGVDVKQVQAARAKGIARLKRKLEK